MENLKKLRIEKGYTKVEIAAAIGVSITAYSNWESNLSEPNEENEIKLKEFINK